jgi:hypothetical protein
VKLCILCKRDIGGKTGFRKLDMSKAYNKVDWNFLIAVTRRMGFGEKRCGLIMQCISSVRFSVLIDGQPMENFKPTRGIR